MALAIRTPPMGVAIAGELTDIDLTMLQGLWSVEQYLRLSDQTNRLLELTDGVIEVLPMPSENHQALLEWLFFALRAFVEQIGGKARFAPLRLQVEDGKFREPDILLVRNANDPRRQNRYWLGADLVVEVVSEDHPERDTEEKPRDYAAAGIPEYWIVNPLDATVTVLTLDGEHYTAHGVFRRGEQATSKLLAGFSVSVDALFDAE